jgi:hypothetical protein
MPSIAINFGRILILIGVIGYFYGYINDKSSITALIPAFFGLVLMFLGYVARAKENLRKHMMHAAILIAFIGFLASGGRLISKFSEITFSAAYISQIAMALTCLIFVLISIKSFIDARKKS